MDYEYKVNARARRISISVRRDGSVLVTRPRRVSEKLARKFAEKNAAWIARVRARHARPKNTSRIEPSAQEYKRYKRAALALVERRAGYFAALYGATFRAISVRNQKSRWGSCSKSGTLSFNYRLIFLRSELADYVVIHEVCHLHEMNHGKRFWALVEKTVPHHRELRKELRTLEHHLLDH